MTSLFLADLISAIVTCGLTPKMVSGVILEDMLLNFEFNFCEVYIVLSVRVFVSVDCLLE